MSNPLDRLKILINSSIPIVVMETVEEMRAVGLVRSACAELKVAVFEWSIAGGLVRSGSDAPALPAVALQMRINAARHTADPNPRNRLMPPSITPSNRSRHWQPWRA